MSFGQGTQGVNGRTNSMSGGGVGAPAPAGTGSLNGEVVGVQVPGGNVHVRTTKEIKLDTVTGRQRVLQGTGLTTQYGQGTGQAVARLPQESDSLLTDAEKAEAGNVGKPKMTPGELKRRRNKRAAGAVAVAAAVALGLGLYFGLRKHDNPASPVASDLTASGVKDVTIVGTEVGYPYTDLVVSGGDANAATTGIYTANFTSLDTAANCTALFAGTPFALDSEQAFAEFNVTSDSRAQAQAVGQAVGVACEGDANVVITSQFAQGNETTAVLSGTVYHTDPSPTPSPSP
ncbi:MAG: hypothetical protein K0Q57_413, partial [Gammaproteobacteria bacterium]|nr:hypothetical protein [Gammaproteobacteria bacterium]